MFKNNWFSTLFYLAILVYFFGLLISILPLTLCEAHGADFDTTTIEILEIQSVYDFFVVKDTVKSTVHYYIPQYRYWYVKGLDNIDYISCKLPNILGRKNEKNY